MKILVTGGTGLLGNNVIRLALEAGHDVTATIRDSTTPRSLADLVASPATQALRIIRSELTNLDSLSDSLGPLDAIIHSAAHIHMGWTRLDEANQTNQMGTKAVVRLARQKNAKLVHVSTVNTLAIPARKEIADEETPGDGQTPCTYVTSKRAAEQVVSDAVAQGLDAVIVHPGFMLGPFDWKPSSGRMILGIANGFWIPVAPSGGCSVCDARDVAAGLLFALQRGVRGRHYILAGENLTYYDLWRRFARQLGKPLPWTIIRQPAQLAIGFVGDSLGHFLGKEPDINSAAIAMGSQNHWYHSERANLELGYRSRPADESIQDAIAWLRQEGYLRSKRLRKK